MGCFTDDDLKRFNPTDVRTLPMTDREKLMAIPALLARLEAAEAYGEFRIRFPAGHDGEKERLEAWRQACGKECGK